MKKCGKACCRHVILLKSEQKNLKLKAGPTTIGPTGCGKYYYFVLEKIYKPQREYLKI